MPRERLTIKFCKTVKPAAKATEYWDTHLTGLSLIVNPGGRKTFFTKFRIHGKQYRRQIGAYPIVGLDEARERAKEILNSATRGIDIAIAPAAPRTVAGLSAKYTAHKRRNAKNPSESERMQRSFIVPALGHIPLDQLTRNDVRALVQRIAEKTPIQANRVLSLAKAMLSWGVSEDLVRVNVAADLRRPIKETPQDRVLTDKELAQIVWAAERHESHPWNRLVAFLAATGARRGEVAGMRWDEVDGDLWTVPASRYKTGVPHVVPLSLFAQKQLRATPRVGPFVFGVTGRSPPTAWSDVKKRLDAHLEIAPWTWHDLRRTVRSGLSRLGVAPHIAERAIGHKTGTAVSRTYDRHEFLQERREAMELWGTICPNCWGAPRYELCRLPLSVHFWRSPSHEATSTPRVETATPRLLVARPANPRPDEMSADNAHTASPSGGSPRVNY